MPASTIKSPGPGATVQGPGACSDYFRERFSQPAPSGLFVTFEVRAQNGARGGALDSRGQSLHPIVRFPKDPRYPMELLSMGGAPADIETDSGGYYLPGGFNVGWTGGTLDTLWDVDILIVPASLEVRPKFRFGLTYTAPAPGGAIFRAKWHTHVRLIFGTLTVNGTAITDPAADPVPLSEPQISAAAGTIYRTEGEI